MSACAKTKRPDERLREDQKDPSWSARQPGFVCGACYERAMSGECRECRAGLEHCHGTVIIHELYRSECTEDGCETPEAIHMFRIDCDAIGCTCTQATSLAI